jgi:molybdopterin synthase catalytic subunit
MKRTAFQKGPIDVEKIIRETGSESDGALVSFTGMARNRSEGKDVMKLEYELYESMALKELDKIVDDAVERWKLSFCTVIHRYGTVNIGEASIVIAVSSPHRKESFSACMFIIDEIKTRVPVWKKEFYSDGSIWITEGS